MNHADMIDRFMQDLEQSPLDAFLRRVFADWCEEHGDPLRAACLRWQADNRKRARHYMDSWQWYDITKLDSAASLATDPASDLPMSLYAKLDGGENYRDEYRNYQTFRETEDDLHRAWASLYGEQVKP